MQPLFEVSLKISDFQILTASDGKKSKLLFAINHDPVTHLIVADQKFSEVCRFILQKKLPKF